MPSYLRVAQGECLSSIAEKYGFSDYKTIYNHPENADFRKLRPNPNIICPKDEIYIPDLQQSEYNRSTDQKHTFVRKKSKVLLRMAIQDDDGIPVSGADYQIFGEETISGVTGAGGLIQETIPADLERLTLQVTMRKKNGHVTTRKWSLNLGHLDPVDTAAGIQARLNNLGYDSGEVDGVIGPRTKSAIRAFQKDESLTVDGIAGPHTQAKLQSVHGC
jgi:hypothetical protein